MASSPDAPPPVEDGGVLEPDGEPEPTVLLDGGAGGCTKANPCAGGGICVAGACCPTKGQVCGNNCCQLGQSCFANACVTPGKLCYSATDCGKGAYCEPALGPKGGSGPPPPGKVCLQPTPSVGRCLRLPPVCPAETPPGQSPGGCLPACEHHPSAGKLDAERAWTWGPKVKQHASKIDVWSTPVVGRLYDTNCDGKINELDPPAVVFVSGDVKGGCACSADKARTGVLRVIDGRSGAAIWSLDRAEKSSSGFAGFTQALGDVDKDGSVDIVAVTGEGKIALIGGEGKVLRISDKAIPNTTSKSFGWGGGLALADMDADGYPEIAYGSTVYTSKGSTIKLLFSGAGGTAGKINRALSAFVDLDNKADGHQELLAGRTAYRSDGTILWDRTDLSDGYPAVGDFDGDGKPEVVLVSKRQVWILEGATGTTELGPLQLPGTAQDNGGPPTVADFDGDGRPEIGVALRQYYYALEADYGMQKLTIKWKAANHDLSSSVTGSTVFDFEGDGSAEVIYNDECFLWVYDGKTGKVRFATPTTSFTATEASMVADINGDGRAEMLMIGNSASPEIWKCNVAPWTSPDPKTGRPAWKPPSSGGAAYRGLVLWKDRSNGWVGTRTLWNQHTYHVSNICDDRDSACAAPSVYGSIPKLERENWKVSWLNNYRQNVQDKGIFNAPDPVVDLKVDCISPPLLHAYLRNQGLAILPAGVAVGFYAKKGGSSSYTLLGTKVSAGALFPGQVEELVFLLKPADLFGVSDTFQTRIIVDPKKPAFHECRPNNNASDPARANCLME